MSSGPLRLVSTVACLTLALSGGVAGGAALVAAGFVAWGRPWPTFPWVWAHLVVIAAAGAIVAFLGTVDGFALLVSWLLAHRVGTARAASDERLGLLLAILVVLLATIGSLSLLLLPGLVALAVSAPAVLLRAQGIQSARLERTTAVAAVVTASMLFLLLPRLQGGLMQGAREPTGEATFPETLSIGDEVDDGEDDRLILRARARDVAGRPVGGALYLRGRTLETFDGARWTNEVAAPRASTNAKADLVTEIMLEPLGGDALFGPPDIVRMEGVVGGATRNAAGDWVRRPTGQRLAYTVVSKRRSLGSGVVAALPPYTQLPELDPAVRAIADAVAPLGAGSMAVIDGTLAFLKTGFAYQENPPPPEGDPLTWFLTRSKAGHCEYYASAAAVILRARGVPARLATGFYSAETSDAGGYVAVRKGHAHAWVEVPVQGGWAVVDPSPVQSLPAPEVGWFTDATEAVESAWYALVLDYDLDRQLAAVERVGATIATPVPGDVVRTRTRAGMAGFGLLFVALFAAGSVLRVVLWGLARPAPPPPVDPLVAALRDARRIVIRRGWALPPSLPGQDAAAWLRAEAGDAAAPFEALIDLVYAGHYAGRSTPGALEEARRLLGELRRMPRSRRG